MMDGDYDVPYSLVKHKTLANGKTFEQTLAPYFGKISLKDVEDGLPLLTIFVPTLPENSFSAELWDTENQVPFVAIVKNGKNSEDISVLSPEGEWGTIERHLIPSFPVVVIKNSERLTHSVQQGFEESKAARTFHPGNGLTYKFLSDVFDNELVKAPRKENTRVVSPSQIDQKLIDAYNTYKSTDGWQRDMIYYDITPSTPNGSFKYNFVEYIRNFKIAGDARANYAKLADDPGYNEGDPYIKTLRSSGWTEGYYEFKVSTLVLAKNGVGETLTQYFSATGPQLFDVTYTVTKEGVWPFRYNYYTIKTVTAKELQIDAFIMNWDLNKYAFTLRIDIEELDLTVNVVESVSVTSTFATNFEQTVGLDKLGLKFGSTTSTSKTESLTKTYTLGSESLGYVLVNFADNVIISAQTTDPNPANWKYTTREYVNSIFSISVEPKRVQ